MLISKIRTLAIKYHLGSLTAALFLFASCSKQNLVEENQSNIFESPTVETNSLSVSSYSPQDIFKAIYFADGPLVNYISQLKVLKVSNYISDSAAIANVSHLHDLIIAKFDSTYPNYLQTFKTAMTSKNQVQIKNKLLDAASKLKPVVDAFYAQVSSQNTNNQTFLNVQQEFATALKNSNIDQTNTTAVANFTKQYLTSHNYLTQQKSACVVAVVVVVAAAAVALIAAVWSGVVLVEGLWVVTSSASFTGGNTLVQDQLVNSIATNF